MDDNNRQADHVRIRRRSRVIKVVDKGVAYFHATPKKGGQGRVEIQGEWDAEAFGDFIISSIPPERIRILPADSN